MAILNFDSTNVAPNEAPEAIPPGWYNAQMTGSEMKPTSDGSGTYLKCEFTILSGDYAKRKQFDRINLQNKNPVAVEIAYRTLSAICHATGVIQVADSQQLHGRPLQIKVGLRAAGVGADGKNHDASNEIKGYKAIAGASAACPGAPAAPAWATPAAPVAAPAPVYAAPAPAAPPWAAQPAPAAPAPVAAPAAAPAPAATPPWMAQPAAGAPAANVPPWARPAA